MSGSLGQFRTLAQQLAQTAFQIAGDLNNAIVYTKVTASSYDITAGAPSNTTAPYSFSGAITRFGPTEIDNKVVITTDAKLLCAYLDLPVEPTPEDTLTSTDPTTNVTKNWKVIRSLGVPGTAMWIIHIRRI